jgi:hypothetical protein
LSIGSGFELRGRLKKAQAGRVSRNALHRESSHKTDLSF